MISKKTDAARIPKRDIEVLRDEYWKPHLFWGQKVKGQSHESQKHCPCVSLHSCECWLLLVESINQCLSVNEIAQKVTGRFS